MEVAQANLQAGVNATQQQQAKAQGTQQANNANVNVKLGATTMNFNVSGTVAALVAVLVITVVTFQECEGVRNFILALMGKPAQTPSSPRPGSEHRA